LLLDVPRLFTDPLATFIRWREEYGDVIRVPVFGTPLVHLGHPEDIRHVLVTHPERYRKTGGVIIATRLLGSGLLSSAEPLHGRQRKIMQPMFHRQRIAAYAELMADAASHGISRWQDGDIVNVSQEMARITLTVAGKAFFSTDFSTHADELARALSVCQQYMQRTFRVLPASVPTPLTVRYTRAVERIDAIIYELIRKRRSRKDRPDDLLTLLIESQYEDGTAVSEKQIRDEVITILLAGHETTANSLVNSP
jgi:cytochrome P450